MKRHGVISSKHYEVRQGQVRRIYYKLPTLHVKKVDTRKYKASAHLWDNKQKNPTERMNQKRERLITHRRWMRKG